MTGVIERLDGVSSVVAISASAHAGVPCAHHTWPRGSTERHTERTRASMLTRLRDESLVHEHLRDLRREAQVEAFRANQRDWLKEPEPLPANEEAPWIRAAFPTLRGRLRLALEG